MSNINTLTEIRKGQTGTGLLVESDGYVSLDLKDNRRLCESVVGQDGISELPRPFVVYAVFQKFGIENANGRIYPEDVLKREVEKYRQLIADRRAVGELEHPEDSNVNLERVCINIIDLWWEGRTLVGKMEILISDGFRRYGIISCLGDQVAHLLLSGIKIGVSSRALGSVKQVGGTLIVQQDLSIISWDVVHSPSTPLAYISQTEDKLEAYKESVKHDDSKLIKEDKYSKFDAWLNG